MAITTSNLLELLNGIDEEMTTGEGIPVPWPQAIAGDKGYPANWIDEMFVEMGSFGDPFEEE